MGSIRIARKIIYEKMKFIYEIIFGQSYFCEWRKRNSFSSLVRPS